MKILAGVKPVIVVEYNDEGSHIKATCTVATYPLRLELPAAVSLPCSQHMV